jgi:hypothetical protein
MTLDIRAAHVGIQALTRYQSYITKYEHHLLASVAHAQASAGSGAWTLITSQINFGQPLPR